MALLTALLLRAEARGIVLADVALASELSRQLGRAVPTLGLVPAASTQAGTAKAVRTTLTRLAGDADEAARLRRVRRTARGRTVQAAGAYYDVGLRGQPEVAGWRRGVSASACDLCRWLERGGHVFPAPQPMRRHPGCSCVPIPVTRDRKAA